MEPPRLPAGFWSRQDVRAALTARDFGTLFRLVSKYAGASQTQIAIAVGMTQSQVSTIMSGERRVTAIDVAERAFDGLSASDDARMVFGLAPRVRQAPPGELRSRASSPESADTGLRTLFDLATEDDVRRRSVLRIGGEVALGVAAGDVAAGPLVRIARALTSYPLLTNVKGGAIAPLTVGELTAEVAAAKRAYQACRYATVLGGLPGLLESVRLACQESSGDERLRLHGLAADAYQVTGSVMLKLGDVGLAAFAADRSMEAALRSGDPVVLAASARAVTHALMAGGHPERAKEIARTAAERLDQTVSEPDGEALSVYGALLLRGAIAAANGEDRAGAIDLLDEAGEAGRRLGRDDNAHWTAFGPTNVQQHRVHVAMLLGDAGTAVEMARRIDVSRIPIAERKAALFIDTARAYVQWGKHEQAYRVLRMADEVAPEEVRAKQTVRGLLADLAERGPFGLQAQVREFAAQIGATL